MVTPAPAAEWSEAAPSETELVALAARLHSNPSNVTVVVARLEARNLLERQVSDDRRVKGVRLTSAGQALKQKFEARLIADHPAVRGLSPADQHALLAILRRL